MPKQHKQSGNSYIHPTINRISNTAKYELWHQRLIHPGKKYMNCIRHYVDGIDAPLKGNTLYRCAACMQGKPRKSPCGLSTSTKHKGKRKKKPKRKTPHIPDANQISDIVDDIYIPNAMPGQHLHMDFGFVHGSNYTIKQETGPTITSKDGYDSYLLIIDRATRYM